MSRRVSVEFHEKKYWHAPRFGLFPLIGFVLFAFLSYANFLGIALLWNLLELGNLSKEGLVSLNQLLVVPSFLFEYALVSGAIVSLVALVKGGYGCLNGLNEEGLLWGLLGGLLFGLLVGLLGGLLAGLLDDLLAGLLFGLLAGLLFGLLVGLLVGLPEEFKEAGE